MRYRLRKEDTCSLLQLLKDEDLSGGVDGGLARHHDERPNGDLPRNESTTVSQSTTGLSKRDDDG